MRTLILTLLLAMAGYSHATGEINVLTDLNSPFPPGCIALSLPEGPASTANTLADVDVWAPGIGSPSKDALVRVQIWRTGCHDPGFSVVMVRLTQLSGPRAVLVPNVFADAGVVDLPFHQAQLIRHPAVGNVGASGNIISELGITYMLGVDPVSLDNETLFLPEDYNDHFTLELYWGDFAPEVAPLGEIFDVFAYQPSLDPTQFETHLLHGRMSGQYTFDGIPATGLQLVVGEQSDDTNYIFAMLFTYMNGEPLWLVGNTGGEAPGFPEVSLGMLRLTGGEFFGLGPDVFSQSDIEGLDDPVGWLDIYPLDCNTIIVGYDFTPMGLGTGVIEGDRSHFRIAGYDCNPWQ
jgi:hypothetical protein